MTNHIIQKYNKIVGLGVIYICHKCSREGVKSRQKQPHEVFRTLLSGTASEHTINIRRLVSFKLPDGVIAEISLPVGTQGSKAKLLDIARLIRSLYLVYLRS